MTKTALRALLVSALSAVILSTGLATAQASTSPACDPAAGQMSGCVPIDCPAGSDPVWDAQGQPSCLPFSADKGDPESGQTCQTGEEFQYGFGCVAVQLPQERIGRQTDKVAVTTPSVRRPASVHQRAASVRKVVAAAVSTAPAAVAPRAVNQLPDWVVLDQLNEFSKLVTRVQWARAH